MNILDDGPMHKRFISFSNCYNHFFLTLSNDVVFGDFLTIN